MSPKIIYKPRFNIAYKAKSKVWPYKDSYLRRFYTLRGRRIHRGGLFRRCVLVATTRKWTTARRSIRPEGRSSGSTKIALNSKTAYIYRLSSNSIKQRYRNLFYKKQLLRSFHGKIKEEAFRQFFRNRVKLVGTHTHSFYDNIESRLDIVFFRMRLLPTIYACHQFIHFYGLELNGTKTHGPRTQVNVGDRISIPSSTWKAFNKQVFLRIYYRRWGLFVIRRRIYKRVKKYVLFIRSTRKNRRIKRNIFLFNKIFTKSKHFCKSTLYNYKKTSQSFIKRVCSIIQISKANYKKRNSIINIPAQLNKIKKNKGDYVLQIKEFLKEIFQRANKPSLKKDKAVYNTSIILFRPFIQSKIYIINPTNTSSVSTTTIATTATTATATSLIVKKKKKQYYSIQIKLYSKILYKFISIFIAINIKKHYTKNLLLFTKLHQFQKRAFSLRLYKTFLPFIKHFKNKGKYPKTYRRQQRRSKRLRYRVKSKKKKNKALNFIRRKSVHFFIPAYLQRDFRTLRAVKVQSPNLEDIYYPFRISLPQRHSFYRSQGF